MDNSTASLRRIYWFAYYNLDSPSVRYRGQYPLSDLKKRCNISSMLIVPGYSPAKIIHFLRAYISALLCPSAGSLIVIQRIHSRFVYASLLKLLVRIRRKITLYDLDDADYLIYPSDTIYHFIRNCAAVSVGSREMVKNLSALNGNIFLNTSPTPDLGILKKERNEIFTIGWIGGFGGGHKESLVTLFFPALEDLPFPVRLILLGVNRKSEYDFLTRYFSQYPNVRLEMPQDIDWRNEKEVQQRIADFDVGIATLLDNEIHRSKSAFKAKQYLTNGVPVLSSRLPENTVFIEHGMNGFFCETPEDFRSHIIEIQLMSRENYAILSDNARHSMHRFTLCEYGNTIRSIYSALPTRKHPIRAPQPVS